VDNSELPAANYRYLTRIHSSEVLNWTPVPADSYLCFTIMDGKLQGAFIPRGKLRGRAIWHYHSGY
jgi:hypothetical protein